ncbi:hypothetical protein NQ176_g5548 [Zarea fungicola]|uniref:Uncharacterized protein n=1 Tax=Zarea fungicola TaxID=93591 RepID=A0ACC1N8H7_9HYPO|nr:hypothetical protein NQ176_g5548 [Lecanicillium fungicola]
MKSNYYLSVLSLLTLNPYLAQAGTVSCGPQWSVNVGNGQAETTGEWKQGQWQDMWDTISSLCSSGLIRGPATATHSGHNTQIQYSIKANQASWHCESALSQIMHKCFDSGNLGGRTSQTGTWNSDSNVDEWYWLDVPDINTSWCPASTLRFGPCN